MMILTKSSPIKILTAKYEKLNFLHNKIEVSKKRKNKIEIRKS